MKETRIDTILKNWILPKGENADKDIEKDIEGHIIGRKFENISKRYYDIFGVIDAKASTLLTHISMMIAANAVLLSVKSAIWLDIASIILLFAFILVALLTLRLLRFWAEGFEKFDEEALEQESGDDAGAVAPATEAMRGKYNAEVCYRDQLYKICLNLTTIFTSLSFIPIVGYLVERGLKLIG